MKYSFDILKTIGNTPLVEIRKMNPNPLVTILVKLEFYNPTGSIKDRIVLHIIEDAEKKGLLAPGVTLLESSSGNTGASIAMIAAVKGYRSLVVIPDKVSQEKQDLLKAFNAEVIVTKSSAPTDSPEHYNNLITQIVANTPEGFYINQYDNPKNPEAHYLSTGPEIWEQTGGKVDYFISSGSSGGTISGIGAFLKEQNPHVKVILADPKGSIYYPYIKTGEFTSEDISSYLMEGIGKDHIPQAMNFSLIDDVISVTDQEAFYTARRLAQEEGIFGGGSGGANLWATLQIAKRLKKPATLVTIIPDSGMKYLSKMYNDEWLKTNHLYLETGFFP